MLIRFPGAARRLLAAWQRLPPGSFLRRALLQRLVRLGSSSANRRDFASLFVGLDPDIEFQLDSGSGLAFPDISGVRHGRRAYRGLWEAADEAWEDFRLDISEAIDFGDQVLLVAHYSGRGRHTGIDLDLEVFQLYVLRDGVVIRQRDFGDRDQALAAVAVAE